MPTHDTQRVKALIEEGRISKSEGDKLLDTIGYVEAQATAKTAKATHDGDKPPARLALAKARFLAGQIDENTFLATRRRLTGLLLTLGALLLLVFVALPAFSEVAPFGQTGWPTFGSWAQIAWSVTPIVIGPTCWAVAI